MAYQATVHDDSLGIKTHQSSLNRPSTYQLKTLLPTKTILGYAMYSDYKAKAFVPKGKDFMQVITTQC